MESDTRESRAAQAGTGRAMNGEKSPAGSVKRARQRAAAGIASDHPMPKGILTNKGSPQNGMSPSDGPHYPPGGKPKGTSPLNGGPIGQGMRKNSSDSESSPRLVQGQTPRPNELGPSPLLQGNAFGDAPSTPTTPIHPRRARNYWEDGFLPTGEGGYSSGGSRPSTTATGSSTASIPDFPTIPSMPPVPSTPPVPPIPQMPVPTYQPPPRRNLGPPPSARRGGSSYYSQSAFVPPIPEENSDAHTSYASSHVMPLNWDDGPPGYYMGDGIDEEEESNANSSGRGSRSDDHTEESGLVRKGSKGRPLQPHMETVESGDESEKSSGVTRSRELDWQAKQDQRFQSGYGSPPGTDPIGRHNFQSNRLNHTPYSGYESDASFLDSPRESGQKVHNFFGTPSSRGSPTLQSAILGHLEKGGAISSGTASPSLSASPSMNEKGFKRPPPLKLDGSKEGQPRSSNTSLPELIRRATRLAGNLDRGNTASRIGMLDMLNAKDKETREKSGKASQNGSISDILAAFPSPSPTASTYHRHQPSNWTSPSPHGKSALSRTQTINYGSSRSDVTPRRRRCCGMPIWAFILLIIILLLLIAAAVVIPITLVVLPKNNNSAVSLDSCKKSNPCQNAGTTYVKNNQCSCICANGFTGSACTGSAVSDGSCTTTDIALTGSSTPTFHNATLGSSIPRLFSAAQSNFSIPLAQDTLASLFSHYNLSCASENALLIFNQKSQRFRRSEEEEENVYEPLLLRSLLDSPSAPQIDLLPRSLEDVLKPNPAANDIPTPVLRGRASAQTSNNIIFAAPGTNGMGSPAGGSSSSSTPTASGSTASSTSSSTPTSSDSTPIKQATLDFARTAVLFIFQESFSLNTATNALDKMQTLLGTGTTFDPTPIAVTEESGNVTVTVDLVAWTVGFGNGTVFGNRGST